MMVLGGCGGAESYWASHGYEACGTPEEQGLEPGPVDQDCWSNTWLPYGRCVADLDPSPPYVIRDVWAEPGSSCGACWANFRVCSHQTSAKPKP